MVLKGRTKMFQPGDRIVYGTNGVCEVIEVTTLNMSGVPSDKVYYVLRPWYHPEHKVFTPVDNDKVVMRPIMTKDEAMTLIKEIPHIPLLQIEMERMREESYKRAIRGGDCRTMISLIKAVYQRNREREIQGRKATATDTRYFSMAQDNLHSELAISLGISKDSVKDFIDDHIEYGDLV